MGEVPMTDETALTIITDAPLSLERADRATAAT
jgi:hypothetical protein